jgi:hypothetical protein
VKLLCIELERYRSRRMERAFETIDNLFFASISSFSMLFYGCFFFSRSPSTVDFFAREHPKNSSVVIKWHVTITRKIAEGENKKCLREILKS